jgi:Vacuolar-sorting-associated 13 protein C-terminal
VSDAPIRLQGKAIEHIFESSTEIFDSIKNYYVNETLKQIYKIIGSLDFVGNPTMVLNSFVTGVRDFFVAPSQEFLRTPNNPSRVGIGVAKGTLSLLSHSASGVFGFAAKMAATAGQAAASLSFDANYQSWHRDMIVAEAKSLDRQYKKRGLQSVQDMLTRPIWDIIRGTALGVSGLIISPYRGAQREGGSGFAKGLVGVITKPTVGVLDAFTHFVGSIHDLAKSVNVLEKRYQPARKLRLPSFFGLQDMLLPFDMITARSVTLLRLYPMKSKRISRRKRESLTETHVVSEILNLEPGVGTYVIVSTQRVLLCKVKKETSGTLVPNLCWELYLFTDSIITPKVQEHGHNGVALVITTHKVSNDVVINSPPSTPMDSGNGQTPGPMTRIQNIGVLDISSHSLLLAAESDQPDCTSPSPGRTPSRQQLQRLHSLKSGRNLFSRSIASGLSNHSRSSATGLSLLGMQPSQSTLFGEEVEGVEVAQVQEGELQLENHLHGTSESQRGEFMEWYTILADFQHRRQLSRVHNAICCVTRNVDAIILDRGLGPDGSTEGYTSFGDIIFTKEDARTKDGTY